MSAFDLVTITVSRNVDTVTAGQAFPGPESTRTLGVFQARIFRRSQLTLAPPEQPQGTALPESSAVIVSIHFVDNQGFTGLDTNGLPLFEVNDAVTQTNGGYTAITGQTAFIERVRPYGLGVQCDVRVGVRVTNGAG